MTDSAKKRILVVDDASLVRLYYRRALEQAGFEVFEALNGLEALERLLTTPVNLLLVDINMPQMDGVTFLKTLRRKELPTGGIPAVVMSTEAGPQDFAAARAAGANFYAIKPVSPDLLVAYASMLCGASS